MEWNDVNKVSLFVSKILVFHLCGTDMGRKDQFIYIQLYWGISDCKLSSFQQIGGTWI